jgi:hypothetical protein
VNLNIWTELYRDGEVTMLKLEYTVQQDGAIQYYGKDIFPLVNIVYKLLNEYAPFCKMHK